MPQSGLQKRPMTMLGASEELWALWQAKLLLLLKALLQLLDTRSGSCSGLLVAGLHSCLAALLCGGAIAVQLSKASKLYEIMHAIIGTVACIVTFLPGFSMLGSDVGLGFWPKP